MLENNDKGEYGKLIIIASVIALLYVSYKIISPFKIALLTSIVLAIALYPIYLALVKKIKNKNSSAMILIFSLIFLVLLPLIFFANAMFQETINLYNAASGMDLSEQSNQLQKLTHLDINYERYFKETVLGLSQSFITSSSKITGYIFNNPPNIYRVIFELEVQKSHDIYWEDY